MGNRERKGVLRAIVEKFSVVAIFKKQALKEKVSIVKRCHCAPGKILDIGAAAGEFLFAMRKEGWDVLGVEMSNSMSRYVLETYGIDCINSDIDELSVDNLKANHFDAVTLWATLAHLYDPMRTLRLCHQVLKPRGKIVILTSNSDSLEEKWFKGIDRNPIDIPRHLYHFNTKLIIQYFEATGFKVNEIHHFTLNACDRLTVILTSLAKQIRGNNLLIRILRCLLLMISFTSGYVLSTFLAIFRRSHTIIIVGEKVDTLE